MGFFMHIIKTILYKIFNFIYRVLIKSHKECQRKKYLKKYNIESSVSFWETTTITGEGVVSIGSKSYIGKNSFISCQEGARLTIGKNCRISHNVHIRTSSYTVGTMMESIPEAINEDIHIGDNVWIGLNVYIKGGVTIGNGAVIGANSVVLSHIGDGEVFAGIPAKLIKRF
jgi:maltose O-acetyltransferase